MLSYRDKTFCASDGCKNECGRGITESEREEAKALGLPISWGWFCGLPGQAYIGDKKSDRKAK